MMCHYYQPRLRIKAVFNSFFGNDFFELTLQVCTEEYVYVNVCMCMCMYCASAERLASLVFRLRRTLAPSALDTPASRSRLISHGSC